jgi:hypothetical protein
MQSCGSGRTIACQTVVRSDLQRLPQLARHQLGLSTYDHTGVAEHHRIRDSELVLAKLIVPPPVHDKVQCTVDLDDYQAAVTPLPRRVEIATPSGGFASHALLDGPRQAEAAAQPYEVDLAERLRPLADVRDCATKNGAMPGADVLVQFQRKPFWTHKSLLYRSGEDAACKARIVERCGRDE